MKIAGIVPFAEDASILSNAKYFKSHIPNAEGLQVFWTGAIVPGETSSDLATDMGNTLEAIKAAEGKGFDAVVLFCHMDFGLEEARELVRIPVLGPLGTSLHLGSVLGRRMCVIVPNEPLKRGVEYRVRAYGLDNMVTIKSMGISANGMEPYYTEYLKSGTYGEGLDRLASVAIKAIEEDDATVLIHGCGSLLWLVDAAIKKLKEKGYDIPFINPIPTTIELAKAVVNLGLTQSKIVYPGFKWPSGSPKFHSS